MAMHAMQYKGRCHLAGDKAAAMQLWKWMEAMFIGATK